MNGELGTAAGRSDLVHLALRLIVEEALEGEVADVLGRERYARGYGDEAGFRSGYRMGKVKTAECAVEYSAPQVRDVRAVRLWDYGDPPVTVTRRFSRHDARQGWKPRSKKRPFFKTDQTPFVCMVGGR